MANVSRRMCSFGLTFCHRRTKQWQCHKSRMFIVTTCQLPQVAARGFASATPTPMRDEVTVVYQRGLPVITLPLPSRREKCRFTLRPISSTVGHFIADVQNEDRGIDRIIIETTEGVRIASSTNIESLMQEDFHLVINNLTYFVSPPETGRLTSEELQKLSDVKAHVAKLYEVLQVGDHQLEQERQLHTELEDLKKLLEPMEKKRESLMETANKRTNYMIWVGLSMMGVQFGVLARLTWWEYSWDIMEPVTYFITYGTTMAMYAYYVLTRQEYYLPAVRDRQFLFAFHKRAQKGGLDVQEYNQLKDAVARVESELKRLRDPLQLHLPIKELTQGFSKDSTT